MTGGETHLTDLVETRLRVARATESGTTARLAVGGTLERVQLQGGGVGIHEPNAAAPDTGAMAAASATERYPSEHNGRCNRSSPTPAAGARPDVPACRTYRIRTPNRYTVRYLLRPAAARQLCQRTGTL